MLRNNYCLFWESYETHKYILCATSSYYLLLKQVVNIVTTAI
jgi:hypothetical protein